MKSHAILFVALAALAGCSKSSDKPSDKGGDKTKVEKGSGSATPTPTPTGSATTMAGSGWAVAASTTVDAGMMAGSGSGSDATMAGSGSGSGSAAAAPLEIKPYTPAADVAQPIKDAISAKDRVDADRALDAGRKPGEVLTFFKIAPGQKVADLFAGGGYTTELLARTVGDKGQVFSQNTKEVNEKFAGKPFAERMTRLGFKQITPVELAMDAPLPPEAKDLDAVVMILNYHDAVWTKVDRDKMNKTVLAALKPGGVYGIVDSAAEKGSGTRDCEKLHRIDPDVVRKEVVAAGFKLDAESPVLANPDDKHDWNSSPKASGDKRGTSDRFTIRFVKPKK